MLVTIFVDWAPRDWSALGQVLLGLGAVVGGGWGVFTYARARRDAAAHWLHSFFLTFYTDRNMIAARKELVFNYPDLACILELRITDRDVTLTPKELEQLHLADLLLNYFEEIIFLQEERHLTTSERDLFFAYWLGLLHKPEYAAVRRYAARCGYEHVASWSAAGEEEYLAISTQVSVGRFLGECADVEFVGTCEIRGRPIGANGTFLIDASAPAIEAHLLRLRNGSSFRALDAKMGFVAAARSINLTHRRCVRLDNPALDAWIYLQGE